MSQVAERIRDAVYARVREDLCPSRLVVHGKVGGAVALGGLVTLFLCGQLGLGFSDLAMRVHHALMAHAGFLGCTAVCGILFAVIPVSTLRLACSALQFQAIIRNETKAIAGWIVAFGSVLAFQNDRSDPLWMLLLWGVAAIGSFEALSRVMTFASRRLARLP